VIGKRGVWANHDVDEIKVNLDNGGSVITTGEGTSFYTASEYGKIIGWHITGYPSGSIVLDIWKRAGAIPTNADSITGTEKPTLSSQQINSDTNLTTWTDKRIRPGDVLGIEIESVSSLTSCVLTLIIQR
jgi:hypothetical protein